MKPASVLVSIAIFSLRAILAQDLGDLTRIKINEALDRSTVLVSVTGSGVDGIGSGFVATSEGWIVTNYHVVADPQFDRSSILVKFKDGSVSPAEILGVDRENDLAILKLTRPVGKQMPHLKLGNSEKVVVGQTVLAKGNPLGLEGTLSQGIVSAVRNIKSPTGGVIQDAIQTDAVVAQGNSGGPLVNALGEVIGVISGGAYNPKSGTMVNNINFAVPIRRAKELIDQVKFQKPNDKYLAYNPDRPDRSAPRRVPSQNQDSTSSGGTDSDDQLPPPSRPSTGRQTRSQPPVPVGGSRDPNIQMGAPTRSSGRSASGTLTAGGWAYLGIGGADYSDGRVNGVKVVEVEPNSPAARAGLRSDNDPPPRGVQRRGSFQSTGHIITAADGMKIESLDDLAEVLGDKYPGDSVTLTTVCCDGTHQEKIKIRVGWALDTRSRNSSIIRGGPNRRSTDNQDYGAGVSVRVIGPDGKPLPPRSASPSSGSPDVGSRQPRVARSDPRVGSPSDRVRGRMNGEPYLGIEGDDYSSQGIKGVKITAITSGSPAEISGLRSDNEPPPRGVKCRPAGQIILSVDGQKVTSTEDLARVLSQKAPGDIIDVTVTACGGQITETVPVKLSSR